MRNRTKTAEQIEISRTTKEVLTFIIVVILAALIQNF